MSKLLYLLFTRLYPVAASMLSLFNNKARLWVEGRRNIFEIIEDHLAGDQRKKIWMHCSSLGEFEQGLPVIEAIRKSYPQYSIVITFFSPSGFEHQKHTEHADHVFYMPADSKKNADHFYDLVNPSLVLFVKYEFWYYYLSAAKKRNTPLLLVSGIFRPEQPFFKWYGSFHRIMLKCFTHFFVQYEAAMKLLQSVNFSNVTVSGDTRFDRVLELAGNFKSIPAIEKFCSGKAVIVAGSTWLEDDEELNHFVNSNPEMRFIIAPHDIGAERLQECETLYKKCIRYSDYIKKQDATGKNTLLIDNIGMLKFLYKYATICYVGGGFGGDGVHNVLEAAVYSKPVIFGPVYDKFIEATGLIQYEGGLSVEDALELEEVIGELLGDKDYYQQTANLAGTFIREKAGATECVMDYIQAKRLLTN